MTRRLVSAESASAGIVFISLLQHQDEWSKEHEGNCDDKKREKSKKNDKKRDEDTKRKRDPIDYDKYPGR